MFVRERSSCRSCLCLLAFGLYVSRLGWGQLSQPVPAANSSNSVPTIHTTARLVVLDVVVTDVKGNPVKGLEQSDFKLFEDGVPQNLVSLTEHDDTTDRVAISTAPAKPLPANTFQVQPPIPSDATKTVILLDNISYVHSPFVREQIRDYLKGAAPGMPIAILRIDWQGFHIVQDLTVDPGVLLEATTSQRILPPLGFEVRYLHRTESPFQLLQQYLAGLHGRINLIWFVNGGMPVQNPGHQGELFPDRYGNNFPELQAFADQLKGVRNELRLSQIAIYPVDGAGLPAPCYGQTCIAPETDLRSGPHAPGSDNFTPPSGALSMMSCQDLLEIGIESGGKGFCNTNGFKEAIAQAIEHGSDYYTLSYVPKNSNWNGAFRTIRVDVNSTKLTGTGLPLSAWDRFWEWMDLTPQVVYRNGYYARNLPDPPDEIADHDPGRVRISYSAKGDPFRAEKEKDAPVNEAMTFGASAPDKIYFRVTVDPSSVVDKVPRGAPMPAENFMVPEWRNQPFRNLKLHYSVPGQDFKFSSANGRYQDDFQFVAVVYRDDGGVVNTISYTAHLDLNGRQAAQIEKAGLSYDQTIAMPVAGKYYLRTAVDEVPTGRTGALEVPSEWIKLSPEAR